METNTYRQAGQVSIGSSASVNSILSAEAQARHLAPALRHLLAGGQPDQACRIPEPAWRASFSQLTVSFTPWAAACPTQLAASSLTRLNMIRLPTAGPQSPPPIQITT